MGETSDEIKQEIERKRDALGEDLEQIEQKVKSAIDWKTQTQKRPFTMVGLAFGSGLLISQIVGAVRRSRSRPLNGYACDR